MLKTLLTKLAGDPGARELKRLQPVVQAINGLEPHMHERSAEEMRALTASFRDRLASATATVREELAAARDERLRTLDADERNRLDQQVQDLEKSLAAQEDRILEEILPEAFAAVREAAQRAVGLRHFDEQLIGGIILHQGKIAEMKTGEGKTLVATLPLYLNALAGHGAHLVTPNDYLSKVGVQWMGPIYHYLGLSVGVIQSAAANPDLGSFIYDPAYQAADDRNHHLRPVPRAEAYAADVTYGTNNEFGFDYLRDNMVWELSQCVQRELHYAIVDEVDNILIDEARTPLIISGPAEESAPEYRRFARIMETVQPEVDYTTDEKLRAVTLTEQGIEKVERALGLDNLYSPEHNQLTSYLENALKAKVLFRRDRDYVVKEDGEVIIVDEFTGRLMYGRRYSEGLHQAIEAKEGVPVQRESLTLATITFQNYFRMYHKLAGMTGTAATESEEFSKIYDLDVAVIPTHRPMIRADHADQVYKTETAKFRAVAREIEDLYGQGQPVLVGTLSIEKSEMLAEMLKRKGVPAQVLNAKQHEREAGIIAQAGRSKAVTIATNMAGRGVDILLGGNPEGLAREALRGRTEDLAAARLRERNLNLRKMAAEALHKRGVDLSKMAPEGRETALDKAEEEIRQIELKEARAEVWEAALKKARAEVEQDRPRVLALGGLRVIGTERHEARRIDNQLRGRSGRQGDPGSSRFYVSLEDDLMRRFGGQSIAGLMERLGVEEDIPIEHNLVSRAIANAQVKVEGYNFDLRKHVLEYDDVVNQQRGLIYEQRRLILREAELKPIILEMIGDQIEALTGLYLADDDPDEWDLNGLYTAMRAFVPLPGGQNPDRWAKLSREEVSEGLHEAAENAYAERESQIGAPTMRQLERLVMLHTVDNLWIRHLTALDELREGIGLRAYGQRDPLVEYKREAHDMFAELTDNIRRDIAYGIFRAQLVRNEPPHRREMRTNAPSEAVAPRHSNSRVGRNDLCPCGSGRKYKNCCMRKETQGQPARTPAAAQAAAGPGAAAKAGPAHTKHHKRKR